VRTYEIRQPSLAQLSEPSIARELASGNGLTDIMQLATGQDRPIEGYHNATT
jgi:hypothetical protein